MSRNTARRKVAQSAAADSKSVTVRAMMGLPGKVQGGRELPTAQAQEPALVEASQRHKSGWSLRAGNGCLVTTALLPTLPACTREELDRFETATARPQSEPTQSLSAQTVRQGLNLRGGLTAGSSRNMDP